jgi:AraC-like DNA-binding protein
MPTLRSVARIGPYPGSRPHAHDCWEIGFYLRGRGVAIVGEERVPFARGTVICYPPFIPHSERAEKACLGFFISADRCSFGHGTRPLHTDRSWSHFLRLASLLHGEWERKEAQWEDAAGHLFALLVLQLKRQCSVTSSAHPLAEALRHEIESRVADPEFHPGHALARLPLSPDHLRRLFIRATGSSPLAYLHELRLARARQLLCEGRWRVKEVAAQVGIPDEYYFSRFFHRHTGQRPAAYGRAAASLSAS